MKKIKTSVAIDIYAIVKGSKVTKVENSGDKYAIIRNIRPVKAIADKFESWRNDAVEALKPSNYDDMQMRLQEWQRQEREGNVTLDNSERAEINAFFTGFSKDIEECMKSELEKEHDMEFVEVCKKSVEQFVDSNDWNIEQVMAVEDFFEV